MNDLIITMQYLVNKMFLIYYNTIIMYYFITF